MPSSGADRFATVEAGGLERDPETIFSHRMPGAADLDLLEDAVDVDVDAVAADGNVRLIMKEFPILGPQSIKAARAALAVAKQGKYEEFHWALMNKPGDMSRAILAGLGMAERFAYVYGGGDLPARKPDPVGLTTILRSARADPAEALMVGDSRIDIRAGRAANVRTVGVSYGFDHAGLLAEPPDLLIDDLRELPPLLASVESGLGERI